MDRLMEKLMISKAIMDRHQEIKRGDHKDLPNVESFNPVPAKYNIPQDLLENNNSGKIEQFKNASIDAIKNSKLPDEIKKLMIEHPIEKPAVQSPTLSTELIEKASRLMKEQSSNQKIEKPTQQIKKQVESNDLEKMVKKVVKEVLQESGLLVESVEKSNDLFSFRVGKHIFEGKITKIKKIT